MHDFCFTIPYGMIVLCGGIIGFVRKGSTTSFAGGVGTGLLLFIALISLYPLFIKRRILGLFGLLLETVIAATLTWVMGQRYAETSKIMPAAALNTPTRHIVVKTKAIHFAMFIDCCSWGGVTCSIKGKVMGLDLSNEMISGGIDDSSALFGLKHLESLNFTENDFSQIPGELSQLTRLEILDLSELFYIGICSLRLQKPNLSSLVQNLTRLRGLYLDNVNISAQKLDWCQGLSSSLPNLEVLSLSDCQLSGPLDDSLGNLMSLSVIRLASNNLSAPVPDFFANFKNLTVMNLGACNLNGTFPEKVIRLQSDFSGRIPKSMEKLTHLSYIDLSVNRLTGQIPSFQLCKNLVYIDLSRNSLSDMIPSPYFQDLNNLVSIDLSFNGFNGNIPSSLFSLLQLQRIQLSDNNFDGPLANFSYASASILDTLDLRSYRLDGQLRVLLLSSNNLSGVIETEEFQGLSNLVTLDLSFNKFSIISSSNSSLVSHLPNLYYLQMASCNLQKFPNLQNHLTLMYVDLSDNKIQGEILNWIWEVGNGRLSYLYLSHNNLTSLQDPYTFPSFDVLDLHSNRLSGAILIPASASYIDFSDNLFNSSLLDTICNAVSLKVLDLSNNRLTKDTTKIGFFILLESCNDLGGRPRSLINATTLEVLKPREQHINDTYPCFLGSNTNLHVIVLRSNNDFNGVLPPEFFSQWGAMMTAENGNTSKKQLRFTVPEFYDLYYQDSVTSQPRIRVGD
ncbi:leucine-rich repeat-containing protein [Tanacetum coccineum]